ncbi:MAG: phosphopantetheine-binding protein [Mucispirillum sp.]|nr:phosphopantetheine-binding protein [Mucispirillum sp.]
MTKAEFLEKLQDIFERDDEITEDMVLEDMDEWDSLSAMAVMAFFNKSLSITLLPAEVREMKTVAELVKKAGL